MFWRRGVFSAARARQMKAALRRPCAEEAAPLGMVNGPDANSNPKPNPNPNPNHSPTPSPNPNPNPNHN